MTSARVLVTSQSKENLRPKDIFFSWGFILICQGGRQIFLQKYGPSSCLQTLLESPQFCYVERLKFTTEMSLNVYRSNPSCSGMGTAMRRVWIAGILGTKAQCAADYGSFVFCGLVFFLLDCWTKIPGGGWSWQDRPQQMPEVCHVMQITHASRH